MCIVVSIIFLLMMMMVAVVAGDGVVTVLPHSLHSNQGRDIIMNYANCLFYENFFFVFLAIVEKQ